MVYTKDFLIQNIVDLGIEPSDTLLIHSSMKSIGNVDGGADTVLDAFCDYLTEGLLVLPTHTWEYIYGGKTDTFDWRNDPACVGILPNIFLKRKGVVRSIHPTHSVAAFGKDARDFAAGEENIDTPCGRDGCWGKLLDRNAKVMFLGCPTKRNTIVHGFEEWCNIPNRVSPKYEPFKVVLRDGSIMERPSRPHIHDVDVSDNYDKLEIPMLETGIAVEGRFGDARCVVCKSKPMYELTEKILKYDPDIFGNPDPVPEDWYKT